MRRRQIEKRDANHSDVVDALRKIGVHVVEMADAGKGFPDLLCGYDGRIVLIEIKDGSKPPSERKLTPAQEIFHAEFTRLKLPCHVVTDVTSALRLFRSAHLT